MPGKAPVAAQAANHVESAVQVNDRLTAGTLVQAVHVLGDDAAQKPTALQLSEAVMGRIRLRGREARPAERAAGPVPAADLRTTDEVRIEDGTGMLPATVRVPIVRNSGGGAAAGAGQRDDPPVTPEQGGERTGGRGQVFSNGVGRNVQWIPAAVCAPGPAAAARLDSAIRSCICCRASRWYSTGRAVAR